MILEFKYHCKNIPIAIDSDKIVAIWPDGEYSEQTRIATDSEYESITVNQPYSEVLAAWKDSKRSTSVNVLPSLERLKTNDRDRPEGDK